MSDFSSRPTLSAHEILRFSIEQASMRVRHVALYHDRVSVSLRDDAPQKNLWEIIKVTGGCGAPYALPETASAILRRPFREPLRGQHHAGALRSGRRGASAGDRRDGPGSRDLVDRRPGLRSRREGRKGCGRQTAGDTAGRQPAPSGGLSGMTRDRRSRVSGEPAQSVAAESWPSALVSVVS
jgi:hypothetical protein